MIKRFAIKKIVVSSLCLFLFLLFYFFPTHEYIENNKLVKEKNEENIVYLLDKDNYVSKVIAYFDSDTILIKIKNIVDTLINGCTILNNFYPPIPQDTKLNSVKVDKNNVYLDFSKEFLSVNKYLEEEMIESIVYSLTEINGIDNIYLSVDGVELTKLPFSSTEIKYPLTREIGINKEYDINTFNDINKTIVVFSKSVNDLVYYVPVTKISNNSKEKIEIIIEELKSPVNSQNDLISYLSDKTKLIDYSINENVINLEFNNNMSNIEEYLISSSIFENYNVNEVKFKFDNNENIIRKKDIK